MPHDMGGGFSADPAAGAVVSPLVSEFADDTDMLELIEMFVEELPQRVEAVSAALTASDFEELARLAHQLKGAGGGYGFPTITQAGAVVEQLAKARKAGLDDQATGLEQAVMQLTDLCRRATAARG